ncbi:MAG TPA: hypothetical protein VFG59_18200, partial [Anaeromyxobacter sp.]|nr:hypothetical protein [Anaeromyxobacter sp.]
PAAKMAHSSEGLMAFLVITIWHIFNVHLNPDAFPFDPAIFTGKIPRERYEHEHPLELARLEGRPPPQAEGEPAAQRTAAKGRWLPSGSAVSAGYYLDLRGWALEAVARDGDRLPGGSGRWRRLPMPAAVAMAPVLGATFLMFMPLAGFLVVGGAAAAKVRSRMAARRAKGVERRAAPRPAVRDRPASEQ